MRYFITFWLLLASIFIFSGTAKAADVVEKVEKKSISAPIEPIKPKTATARAKFWKSKFKKHQIKHKSQVEPIAGIWYVLMGIYTLLSVPGFLAAGVYFVILSVLALGAGSGGLTLAVFAAMIIGTVLAILYAIKLFAAAMDSEGGLNGLRFILGYLVGILFTIFWLGISISFFGVQAAALGIILPAAILIFNIIDHLRYRKYIKSLGDNVE